MGVDRGQIDTGLASGMPSKHRWWKHAEWPIETVVRTAPDSGRAAPWALLDMGENLIAAFPSAAQLEQALGCAHGSVNTWWKTNGNFRAVYRFRKVKFVR